LIPTGGGGAEALRFDQPTVTHVPGITTETEGSGTDQETLTQEARQLIASREYVRRCCEIIRDAALAHAHERGVTHRDIKPEKLLLDRQLRVHVIDFGIARFFEDMTVTNTGQLVGTPLYMSPEQVTGLLKLDHRTDIYSLGLVLYELLTLRRPIEAPSRE